MRRHSTRHTALAPTTPPPPANVTRRQPMRRSTRYCSEFRPAVREKNETSGAGFKNSRNLFFNLCLDKNQERYNGCKKILSSLIQSQEFKFGQKIYQLFHFRTSLPSAPGPRRGRTKIHPTRPRFIPTFLSKRFLF